MSIGSNKLTIEALYAEWNKLTKELDSMNMKEFRTADKKYDSYWDYMGLLVSQKDAGV